MTGIPRGRSQSGCADWLRTEMDNTVVGTPSGQTVLVVSPHRLLSHPGLYEDFNLEKDTTAVDLERWSVQKQRACG